MLQNPFLRPFARVAFKYEDMVIPVSKNTESRLLKFVKPRKHSMIYNAVDCPGLTGSINKEKIVLTVGMVGKISSLVKGHFLFLEVARRIPDVKFILYGQHKDNTIEKLREKAAKNVEFIDHSSRKDLLELYRKSMIYAQLSYDESFGVSVIEAMACGCTPFVTSNGALPEIVGNCGVIVNSMDPEIISEKL